MKESRGQFVMPSRLDRYELKFTIPESLIPDISAFAEIYCAPDKYSVNSEDGFYTVNNLYLDTPRFLFLRNRIDGCENRFNMRIRAYGDEVVLPHYLEVKEKRSGIIRKSRGVINDPDWRSLLERYECPSAADTRSDPPNRRFLNLMQVYQAAPKVRTQYRRKAYVSQVNEYARLTFDKSLKCMREEDFQFAANPEELHAYDTETFFDPGCCIILELKCYASKVPVWLLDLIRQFGLRRRSFSKYVSSMTAVWDETGYDPGVRAPVV